jgi:hypothetical protein
MSFGSAGEECQAALHIASRYEVHPADTITLDSTAGSSRIWKLARAGRAGIRSTTAHHWAAAGAALACFDLRDPGEDRRYRFGVLCAIYPAGTVAATMGGTFRVAIAGTDTPFGLDSNEDLDRVITYARQRFGIETYTAEDYNKLVRGEFSRDDLLVEKAPLRLERPDYEALEEAIAAVEKLTS